MSMGAIGIVFGYLLVTLIIGIYGYKATSKTAEDYFLANRAIGTLVFFFTMVATHISGFSVFGLSGMAYRTGFAAYEFPFLANIFVPIFLYIIGYKVWLLGKWKGYVTPTEFFADRFKSEGLRLVILAIWITFNLPFLAIQWTAAGYTLSGLTQGAVPFTVGVVFLTLFTVAYVYLGGMKSVAWTDTFQGIVMFLFFILCGAIIIQNIGGFAVSLERLYREYPDFFTRPGGDGVVTTKWAFGMILLGMSALMAPQLFIRFYVPKSEHQFKVLSVIWIPTVSFLMFMSVLVGALGKPILPDLVGKGSDEIYAILLARYTPALLGGVFSGGVLAALMSTASAVLLVLSSLLTRDIYLTYVNTKASETAQVWIGRSCVLAIGVISCLMALRSDATIFNLLVYAWSAFSMILPTTIAALYWRKANAWGCMTGIIAGLTVVIGLGNFIPESRAWGFPAIVPGLLVNTIFLVGVSYLTSSPAQIAGSDGLFKFLDEACEKEPLAGRVLEINPVREKEGQA